MKRCLTAMLLLFLVAATAARAGVPAGASLNGILLLYQEQEPGSDSYPVRMLVVPGFLRIDAGHDGNDFLLFDRADGTVYSVSSEDRTILVMATGPVAEGDTGMADIRLGSERIPDAGAPAIAGRIPEFYRFTANGETCLEAAVVPGLLEPAVQALMEYGRALARRQRADLEKTPEEFRTPCFLSRYVLAPVRHLEKGLPVREWDNGGYWRELTDFRADVPLEPGLFTLPQEYDREVLAR